MKKYILLLCLIPFLQNIFAQTRAELEAERIKLNNQIQASNKKLSNIEKTKKESKAELQSLKQSIKAKEQSAATLQKNLQGLDERIKAQEEILQSLQSDLAKYKLAYQKTLLLIYKYKRTLPQAMHLFLPKYWEEIYRMEGYLRKLESLRKEQLSFILQTQESINMRKRELEQTKLEEDASLQKTIKEKETIAHRAQAQDALMKKLSAQEQELKKQIEKAQKSKNQLNNKIESVIRNEMAIAKNNARQYETAVGPTSTLSNNKTANPTSKVTLTPQEEAALTKGVLAQKGKLSTPAWGKVVSEYGRRQHPDLPLVIIENNGVDIQTAANASVFSIYEGLIVNIFAIPGIGNAIMIKHGDFYSIYAGVKDIQVSSGQKVKTKQTIAYVSKDNATNNYILHFEFWRNKQKENPRHWVKL